jgi:hypothetical protein
MNHRYSGQGSESKHDCHKSLLVPYAQNKFGHKNYNPNRVPLAHVGFFYTRPEIIRYRMVQKSVNQVH